MTFWKFLGWIILAGIIIGIGFPLLQIIIVAIIALFSNNK